MKNQFSILLLLLLSINLTAQQTSNWKNYTCMQNTQDIISTSNGVWAATDGGGFYFDLSKDIYKTLHRTDGLNGINLISVTVDNYGKVWFGSKEGVIDVYNPADNSIKSILDIFNSNYAVKQINGLKASGDSIFVSTSYGISIIDAKSLLFIDTFFKFGSLSSSIPVNSIYKSDLLYACTQQGLAIQKQGATNLSAPESWNVYTTSNGLPSNNVTKVILYNGSIIAGTNSGLAIYDGTAWQKFQPQISTIIYDLMVSNDSLFILSDKMISIYNNNSIVKSFNLNTHAVKLSYLNPLGLLAADTTGIIEVYSNTNSTLFFPNGPASNLFPSMTVDNNGNLWSASGKDVISKGFYKYDGKLWTDYNRTNNPGLLSNAFYTAYAAPDNSIYMGNWGAGFAKINGDSIQSFYSNTGLVGSQQGAPLYVVISGLGVDSKSNLWALNFGSVDLKTLHAFTQDSIYHYHVDATGSGYMNEYHNLIIDQYDTKWFYSQNTSREGLFYFNENGSYNNQSPTNGYLSTNDGLTSNVINSIVMDTRGDIWVGTGLGVNIISNTESITSGSTPSFTITNVFPLREYSINCIAVDPINQKWIGTSQGLLLVNSDGSELLATYNTTNSPLLSDDIISIAVDKNKGIVYVGTNNGLTSFSTPAIEPKDSFSKLFIYPSPFVLKSGTNKVTIDGLIRGCNIKIVTIYGKLVKEITSPGGRVAYWDGTNTNGSLVNSGVYIVVAYDTEGNSVCTGKIAVVRK
ncbi:MAG: two-component regulator propeller domain-containing protein [Ignavibacteriaceae bacterium]|nr:two-component regulator propeller domain-containing protein [Ignavibacteriaceae bacterium]